MEDLDGLITRTDGWIAGLQMVSIALEGKADPTRYIQEFSGNQEYIADYLTSEVFAQQTDSTQQFLMKTSILERFCSSLCEAITGLEDSGGILKTLKDKNLFLVSLDDENHWFCYHRLFADLNHQRLLEDHAEEISACYQKASEWFEVNQLMPEAIEYAFRGGLTERAASLIEAEAEAILSRSEITTFVRWVEKLPDEMIIKRGTLSIYYAWALIAGSDDFQKAAAYLENIDPEDEPTRGRVNTVKVMISVHQRDIKEAIRLANLALEQLPEQDYFFRQVAAWKLSALLFISGDEDSGAQILEEVARVSLARENLLVAIVALCRLGSYRYHQGDLILAKDLFERAVQIQPAHQNQPVPVTCEAMLGLGKVYWERAEFEAASRYLQDGLRLRKKWRAISDVDSLIVLAHLHQYQGEDGRANQLIEEAMHFIHHDSASGIGERYVASHQALIHLRGGNHPWVEHWVSERKFDDLIQDPGLINLDDRGTGIVLLYELLVYTRYLISCDRIEEGLGILERLQPSLEVLGYRSKIIEIHVLKACGYQAVGKIDQAITALKDGLQLAEAGGYKRIFMEGGSSMADLIETALAGGFDSRFAGEILSDLKGGSPGDWTAGDGAGLIDPLSDREIEVLKRLDSQLSIPEIANLLHIAVSTLRTHIRNIYSKLGVHSRFEAVVAGKKLNLI
jgi:LuxR family maltose regulon positive regulatory protein